MWVAKRLDMPWRQIARALASTFHPGDRIEAAAQLERDWSPTGQGLAALSVRSALDLYLSATNIERGGEVLMSAITLDDMHAIVESHGLTPIPLDLDTDRLAPNLDDARWLLTPRTQAVVIAHLFGGRIDLRPWGEFCRAHQLLLIEDCAQAFDGMSFTGHAEADASLFSFGPIKTATALGGALATVRDASTLAQMRAIQSAWPVQRTRDYRRRLLTYAALKAASSPWPYGIIRRRRPRQGDANGNALRNFPGCDLLTEIRHQPCAALLKTLHAGLMQFDERSLARRIEKAKRLHEALQGAVIRPGAGQCPHNAWVFPIVVEKPEELLAELASAGFDAIAAASMRALPAPTGRPELAPRNASAIAPRMLYLPCYPELPDAEIDRMATVVRGHSRRKAIRRLDSGSTASAVPAHAHHQLQ